MKKQEWQDKIKKLMQQKHKIQISQKEELKEINKQIRMLRSCIYIYKTRGK